MKKENLKLEKNLMKMEIQEVRLLKAGIRLLRGREMRHVRKRLLPRCT